MSKFCQNCGNMLDDNAAFCDKCGKPLEAPAAQPAAPQYEAPAAPQYEAPAAPQYQAPAAPQYQAPAAPQYQAPAAPQYQAPAAPQYGAPQYGAPQYGTAVAEKKGFLQFVKDKKIFFICGGVLLVAVIVLIVILSSCGASSAEGALNKAFSCAKNLDIRGAADVDYDMNFKNGTDKEAKIKESEEQVKQYGEMVSMVKEMMKSAQLKITKTEPVKEDELKSLKESWASDYKDTDKITEIDKIEYEISGVMGSSNNGECYGVKCNGKWYVKDFSGMGSL